MTNTEKQTDTTNDLTLDDIATLTDALKAWEEKDVAGGMLTDLLGAMLLKEGSTEQASWKANEVRRKEKADQERRERQETSVILQAKLLTIRRRIAVRDAESVIRAQQ